MPPTAPVCALTLTAWRIGGLALGDLWGRYVSLGGHHSQSGLAAYLNGAAAWPDTEHDVLAHAINEGLWDLGMASLAPYRVPLRAPEPAPRDAAPDTWRPSP